jgi:D-methionine transport system ATP-binding protein
MPFTQQLVSRTLNLTLPDRLREHLPGQLLKILFIGDSAEQPVLSGGH